MKNAKRSICPFCSMGCSLLIRPGTGAPYVGQEGIPALDYDEAGPTNRGSLCGKGNMALELLLHPKRLEAPLVRGEGGALGAVSWDAALDRLAASLEGIRREDGAVAIGLLAGPYLTNEEAKLAVGLAQRIGTPHLDFSQPEDRGVLAGLDHSPARPQPVTSAEQIDGMTAMLTVGDVFTLAPCLSKPVLNARYDRHKNVLGVLGFWKSRTALFGKPFLKCRPGQEAAALALMLKLALAEADGPAPAWASDAKRTLDAMDTATLEAVAGLEAASLGWLLDALRREEHTGVFLGCGFAETERPDLVAGLSALLAEATGSAFLPLFSGPNSLGVRAVLREAGYPRAGGLTAPEMAEAAGTGDLRAIVALGCDPLGSVPGRLADDTTTTLDLMAVTGPLPGETTNVAANIVLAAATWGEKVGSVRDSFGGVRELADAMPPPGTARTDRWILEELSERIPASGGDAADDPAAPQSVAEGFFDELELHFRMERRGLRTHEVGTHYLFPEYFPSHAGDGWLTRHLSWPRHELPEPTVALSPRHAAALGVGAGDRVWVRSRDARAELTVRLELNLPEGIVLAPPHFPEVRQLTSWRLDPTLRDLDVRPGRVSVEVLEENDA